MVSAPGSYAAAVRRIVIPADPALDATVPAAELVLPAYRPIPAPRKSLARTAIRDLFPNVQVAQVVAPPRRVNGTRRPQTRRTVSLAESRRLNVPRAAVRGGEGFDLGALSRAASMLDRSHPSLAGTLRSIVGALRPLLALAPLLQGLVTPSHNVSS